MRKSLNVLLAAGLAASAFASTAAAPGGCSNEDGDEVIVVKDGYETEITGQSAAANWSGFRTVSYFQVDTSLPKKDVNFTLTNNGGGQLNFRIDIDGAEAGRAEAVDGVAEITLKRLADCTTITVFTYAEQLNGGPTSPLVNATFSAIEG